MDKKQYWNQRAQTYSNLEWVKNNYAMSMILDTVNPQPDDIVLDVGTGLGAMAIELASSVEKVIGIDSSYAMLCRAEKADGVFYVEWDACKSLFAPRTFDKIVARQVIHHIPNDALYRMLGICNDILKIGGKIFIIEPVCPAKKIRDEYEAIFALKDGRNVLTAEDIEIALKATGFVDIIRQPFVVEGFSVKNWLDNNALEKKIQDRIFEMHVTASPEFKLAYNMQITNGDCLIDIQNVIVTGEKA
ncbi:MAG: class I SAM-dependent methyltransferase [Candidatus Marinimicrobia bacterium]|nr:class I SAM-dependent methyltransferase [Candidatus Neomarinimicrobiota bacterium]